MNRPFGEVLGEQQRVNATAVVEQRLGFACTMHGTLESADVSLEGLLDYYEARIPTTDYVDLEKRTKEPLQNARSYINGATVKDLRWQHTDMTGRVDPLWAVSPTTPLRISNPETMILNTFYAAAEMLPPSVQCRSFDDQLKSNESIGNKIIELVELRKNDPKHTRGIDTMLAGGLMMLFVEPPKEGISKAPGAIKHTANWLLYGSRVRGNLRSMSLSSVHLPDFSKGVDVIKKVAEANLSVTYNSRITELVGYLPLRTRYEACPEQSADSFDRIKAQVGYTLFQLLATEPGLQATAYRRR